MRRAFVLGSNGPKDMSPLRFALSDAERIVQCLTGPRCGFEVISPEAENPFSIREQLFNIAETCEPEDTFICYFSGHGILEKGSLLLILNRTDMRRPFSTALPVYAFLEALKMCRSDNKLLILDCCHAGAVANMLGLKDGSAIPMEEIDIKAENHYVLMASGRLEKARELESLQGSFLTSQIISALGLEFDIADIDNDRRLSMQDLKSWLERNAKHHNRQHPNETVPVPYLVGQQKGEFYLTIGPPDWVPYEITWVDGSIMVLLPTVTMTRDYKYKALAMSKYPITNAQYRKYIEETGGKEIVGQHYIDGTWKGPFYPWREQDFQGSDQPVVCVSYDDAKNYCAWVNQRLDIIKQTKEDLSRGNPTDPNVIELEFFEKYKDLPIGGEVTLPTPRQWDFAAFGREFPSKEPKTWISLIESAHHNAAAPAPVDREGKRSKIRGISDLLGNVWEWCGEVEQIFLRAPKVSARSVIVDEIEIRGCSFLDDLAVVSPFLDVYRLRHKKNTRHSDLGFRTAVKFPVHNLPNEIQIRLQSQEPHQITL